MVLNPGPAEPIGEQELQLAAELTPDSGTGGSADGGCSSPGRAEEREQRLSDDDASSPGFELDLESTPRRALSSPVGDRQNPR